VTVPQFLLDTNVLSEPLKPSPNLKVMAQLAEHGAVLAIASVTYHEVKYGYLRLPDSQRKERIYLYIQQRIEGGLSILPYDDRAAAWHAAGRDRLTKQGKSPPYVDGQIAAIAAVNQLVLVTRNVTDFENFQDLQLENWFA
jgi:tRNA(fMet)-specific endonuclease VapC